MRRRHTALSAFVLLAATVGATATVADPVPLRVTVYADDAPGADNGKLWLVGDEGALAPEELQTTEVIYFVYDDPSLNTPGLVRRLAPTLAVFNPADTPADARLVTFESFNVGAADYVGGGPPDVAPPTFIDQVLTEDDVFSPEQAGAHGAFRLSYVRDFWQPEGSPRDLLLEIAFKMPRDEGPFVIVVAALRRGDELELLSAFGTREDAGDPGVRTILQPLANTAPGPAQLVLFGLDRAGQLTEKALVGTVWLAEDADLPPSVTGTLAFDGNPADPAVFGSDQVLEPVAPWVAPSSPPPGVLDTEDDDDDDNDDPMPGPIGALGGCAHTAPAQGAPAVGLAWLALLLLCARRRRRSPC